MRKKKASSYQRLKEVALGRAMYNLNCVVQVLVLRIHLVIPHICHGHRDGVRGEKICHVEKFQISVHETCGES